MTQKAPRFAKFKRKMLQLRRDNSGLAMVEFAVSLPFFLGLTIGGFEMANYAQTVMKLNQITIHAADSAARMGEDTVLAVKQIKEMHINDVFAGSIREGQSLLLDGQHAWTDPSTGTVSLRGNALIILSSVEPVAAFDPDDPKYRIRWQRCLGQGTHYASNYGTVADSSEIDAIGPTGRQVVPPDDGAIMFVETQYYFQPAILNGFTRVTDRTISHVASMVVRDRRDYTAVYNPEGVAVASCS